MCAIVKQLIHEFRLPVGVGLLWTASQYWFPHGPTLLITNFMAALFLTSWAQGHYLRVKYHKSVESGFKEVKSQLGNLISTMSPLPGMFTELLEQTKNLPDVHHTLKTMAVLTSTANTQLAQAKNIAEDLDFDDLLTPKSIRLLQAWRRVGQTGGG
jgi:hypothetical protein